MNVAQLPSRPVLEVVTEGRAENDLSVEELGSRIVGMAGRLAAATCRWLLLVAAFDARDGCARFGLPTTARWLSHYCGLSWRTAMEHVRVSRALAAYPVLVEAMSGGRISYSHARAISRVAELGEGSLVAELVTVAEHGTVAQLEDMVRGLRTIDDNNRGADRTEREAVSRRWRPDSRMGLSARLDPEHGALVWSAITAVAEREGLTQVQALTRVAEIALAALAAAGDDPTPVLRGDEHAAVVIHYAATPATDDAGAASAASAASGGPDPAVAPGRRSAERSRAAARIAGGPGLPAAVVERLACSGRIRLLTFDPRVPPGEAPTPLDVGDSRRLVSDKQFRALLQRDGGCAHPGCASRIGLEAHHVRHWLYGGRTRMANLVLLCRRHHHTLHDGEFRIVPRGPGERAGRFRFLRSDGCELPQHVDPSVLAAAETRVEDEHHRLAPDAATTRWDGTRLGHHYALAGVARRLHSTGRLSA